MIQELDLAKQRRDANGYMYVYDATHPLANKSGKVYVHRYVASVKVSRYLTTQEHAHHLNGVRTDNSPDNIEVLNAKDHAKTHNPGVTVEVNCPSCTKDFTIGSYRFKKKKNKIFFCSTNCASNYSKKFDPDYDELFDLVWTYPSTKVADIYGVSDVAIVKRCKLLGIPKPPRGFWRKLETGKIFQK